MRRLRNFFRLSGGDHLLLLTTILLLSTIRFGMLLLPFRILLKILRKSNQVISQTQNTHQVDLGKIVWAVNIATRYTPGGAKCLARALTTQVLMNSYGDLVELRIGVAKGDGGKLEAHAWVEYQGRVAIGYLSDLSRYIPLPSLEGVRL